LLDVDRFRTDPVVVAMSPLSRAFYCLLLTRLWDCEEPGVVPDDDRVLKGMCEAGEHWPAIRDDIRFAFDAKSRPGFLVQHGTVKTHRFQVEWLDKQAELGRRGAEKRWAPHRHPMAPPKAQIAVLGSGFLEESKNTLGHSASPPDPVGLVSSEETPKEWAEGFEHFWLIYPRKVSKAAAKASYMKLKPRTQATYDTLLAGLRVWLKEWEGRDMDKVPHASTWLNQRRFLDAEDQS